MVAGSGSAPPLLRETEDFQRWMKLVKVWSRGTSINVEKHASVVIMNLTGKYQDVALEMEEGELTGQDGLKNLLKRLEEVFMGDSKDLAYEQYVKFEKIKREETETVTDYIIRFEKVNKDMKGINLNMDDSILALKLLSSCNLTGNERKMILTACTTTTFENVKSALKRILGSSVRLKESDIGAGIKEECFFTRRGWNNRSNYRGNRGRANYQNYRNQDPTRRGNTNERDRFGNIRKCMRCGSIYHLARDCYAVIKPKSKRVYFSEQDEEYHYEQDEEYQREQDDDYRSELDEELSDMLDNAEMVLFMDVKENFTYSEAFIVESMGQAIVDTACAKTCCGEEWYKDFKKNCNEDIKEQPSSALLKFGSATPVTSLKSALLPVQFGGKEVKLSCEVLPVRIPLLLSNDVLAKVNTLIDVKNQQISMFGEDIPVQKTSNGHFVINITRNIETNDQIYETEENVVLQNVVLTMTEEEVLDEKSLLKLHKQFGHCSYESLARLMRSADKATKETLESIQKVISSCKICNLYKKTPPRPKVCLPRASRVNESVGVDLHQIEDKYMLHMIDEFSRFSVAVVMNTKKSVEFIDKFIKNWIRYFGYPKKLFSDNGGEFNSHLVREFGETFNIKILTTAAYSPWSNGLVERHNGIISLMLKKMRESFPDKDLDTLMAFACAAKNSLLNKDGYSPNQIVYGSNTNLPSVLDNKLSALEQNQSSPNFTDHIKMIFDARKQFITAESSAKIMAALKRPTVTFRRQVNTGDLVYYKAPKIQKWKGPLRVIGTDNSIVFLRNGGEVLRVHRTRVAPCNESHDETQEIPHIEQQNNTKENSDILRPPMLLEEHTNNSNEEGVEEPVVEVRNETGENTENVQPEIDDLTEGDMETNEEEEHDEEEEDPNPAKEKPVSLKKGDIVQFRDLDDEVIQAKVTSRAGKVTGKFLNWYNLQDLNSNAIFFEDITKLNQLQLLEKGSVTATQNTEIYLTADFFKDAKQKELQNWKDNKVYKEIDRDKAQSKILETTWVCNVKDNQPKARLVVRGYQEDTSEISKESPTCNKESVRILMLIVSTKEWKLHALDIKSAFLQGATFVRKVYITPPIEAEISLEKVWQLLRCVYGLADASLNWYNTLKALFLDLGGTIGIDPGVFFWSHDGQLIGVLSIHVDDIMYAGTMEFLKNVMDQVKSSFHIRLQETECFKFLGINITQNNKSIKIDQNTFVDNLEITPLELNGRDLSDPQSTEEFGTFQANVGKILWVCNQTRPDVNFETCILGSSMQEAKLSDYKKCIKVLRNLKNNDNSLVIRSIGDLKSIKLILYSDASLNNLQKGGSQGGYLIFVTGANQLATLLTWSSKRLKRVVRSTIESETLALAEGLEHCIYITRIFKLLLNLEAIEIECRCDNKSLCTAVHSEREVHNKRLALEIYNLKHLISNENVTIRWIKKDIQLADILTKAGVSNDYLMSVLRTGDIDIIEES